MHDSKKYKMNDLQKASDWLKHTNKLIAKTNKHKSTKGCLSDEFADHIHSNTGSTAHLQARLQIFTSSVYILNFSTDTDHGTSITIGRVFALCACNTA